MASYYKHWSPRVATCRLGWEPDMSAAMFDSHVESSRLVKTKFYNDGSFWEWHIQWSNCLMGP